MLAKAKTLFHIAFTSAILFILSACHEEKKVALPPTQVTVVKMEPQTIPQTFEFVGFTKSSHPVDIYARVQGYIDRIGYTEGHMVERGDLLFQLDPRPFIAAVDRAKGALSKEEAILWNARVSRERLEPLYVQHAASRRDLDNAIANQLAAEASVQSAKANLVEAELNLSYTTILSPISGLSGRAKYREGTLITPGENAQLTTISVLDPIWVDFNVPSNDLLKYREDIKKGYLLFPKEMDFTMEIVLADGTAFPFPGKANFASPTLDERTGTMLVRAFFANPYNSLKPGEFARVRAKGAVRPNSLFVPQSAVLESKSGTIVYVVNEKNQAEMLPVVAGDWYEKAWVIQSGLKAGDRVIVDGVNKVQPGTSVIITKEVPSTDPTLLSTGSINPPKGTKVESQNIHQPESPPQKLNSP
jgi:membrane fusion protein (multidrug efflux system)